MSHDRGCHRCFEDHPRHRAASGECKEVDCPYKMPVEVVHEKTQDFPKHVYSSEKTKRLKVSWQTIFDGVDALANMVRPSNPELIVGVSRGGLIPATILSHKLGIPLRTIAVSAYEGTRRTLEKPLIVEGWEDWYDSNRTLIVDDILDSGDTISAIRHLGFSSRFAVLVTKQPMHYSGVHYFAQTSKETWVQFPWEQEE